MTGRLKGTSLHKPTGKWRAVIRINGKDISLKYHDTEELAHAAYMKAAEEML
jgi:hypothetical protein